MYRNSKTPGTGLRKADDRLSTFAPKTVSFQTPPVRATKQEVSRVSKQDAPLHNPAKPSKNYARTEQVVVRKGVPVRVSPVQPPEPEPPARPVSPEPLERRIQLSRDPGLNEVFQLRERKDPLIPLLTEA
jgi:hypothetical protein